MPSTSITIACIVRNVEAEIDALCDRLRAAANDASITVNLLIVDDGSSDHTFDKLRAKAASETDLRALRLSREFGEGGAVTAALNHCVGEACLLVIGADQPLDLIPEMIEHWRAGVDLVWTTTSEDAQKSFSTIVRVTTDLSRRSKLPTDHVFALTLLSAPVVRIWRSLPHRDDHLPLTLASYGFEQKTIVSDKIRAPEAAAPASQVASFVNRLIDNTIVPVRLTSTAGILIAMVALAYILLVTVRALVFDLGEPGWSTLVVTILFVASAQIISIGILAEYIWRVFQQTRNTPRYIIKDVFGQPSRPLHPSWSLDPLDLDTSADRKVLNAPHPSSTR